MDLGNYQMRWTHVWSRSSNHLAFFLGEKLNADFGSNTVDAAEKRLVMAALLRSPQSFAQLYLRILRDYANPFQWQFSAQEEMGLKPLPDDFVSYFNSFSVTKLTPETSEIRSPLVRIVEKSLWLYPLLLGLGICAAIFLLLREGARPAVTVLGAALFADLLAVPLYSLSLVPRFLLAAIFVSYLLIGLAGLSLFSSRMERKTGKSHP